MAVLVEFTSIIVPIRIIREKCGSGRWESHYSKQASCCWHDKHLFRMGAMIPYDIARRLREWEAEGLSLRGGSREHPRWQDVCVVDFYEGPTLPCSWLEFDPLAHCVWLAGKPRGAIVGPKGREIEGGTQSDSPALGS